MTRTRSDRGQRGCRNIRPGRWVRRGRDRTADPQSRRKPAALVPQPLARRPRVQARAAAPENISARDAQNAGRSADHCLRDRLEGKQTAGFECARVAEEGGLVGTFILMFCDQAQSNCPSSTGRAIALPLKNALRLHGKARSEHFSSANEFAAQVDACHGAARSALPWWRSTPWQGQASGVIRRGNRGQLRRRRA